MPVLIDDNDGKPPKWYYFQYGVLTFKMFCPYRGHTVRAVTESFQMAKDAGFKVVAHMMPDLPNMGLERDIQQFVVRLLDLD